MPGNGRYPAELREWAVRMVLQNERLRGSGWEAICSAAGKLCPASAPATVRKWVRCAEVDGGTRAGVTTAGCARIKELEGEVGELRRPIGRCTDACHFRL